MQLHLDLNVAMARLEFKHSHTIPFSRTFANSLQDEACHCIFYPCLDYFFSSRLKEKPQQTYENSIF